MKKALLIMALFFVSYTALAKEAVKPVVIQGDKSEVLEVITCAPKTKVKILTKDVQRLEVTMVEINKKGVLYTEKTPFDGERKGSIAWMMLSAGDASNVLKAGVNIKSVAQLLFAARILQSFPDGVKEAAKWYVMAEKLGGKEMVPLIISAKKEASFFPTPLIEKNEGIKPSGQVPHAWPTETSGTYSSAVKGAIARTEAQLKAAKIPMVIIQNELFVLYSNLSAEDTKKWAVRFNTIYEGLYHTFINPDRVDNIWHGKAVVLLFKTQEEYVAYHAVRNYGNMDMVRQSGGLSSSSGEGDEEISLWQNEKFPDFTLNILYHEFSHGFFFRYESQEYPPSWVNEGLAEFMTSRFIGENHSYTGRIEESIKVLQESKSFEDFFVAKNIQFKHYGAAHGLVRMMIECSPQRFGAFLSWLKRGEGSDSALQKSYGITLEQLVQAYGKRIGVENLKSH